MMKRSFRLWLCWNVSFCALTACLSSCERGSDVPSEASAVTVLLDARSSALFTSSEAGGEPAVHPRTGRKTLMPALYCPRCQKWHPVPPVEQLQRSPRARQCPKTGVALVANGPVPESARELSLE